MLDLSVFLFISTFFVLFTIYKILESSEDECEAQRY